MPKAKIYSTEELRSLSIKDIEKIVRTQAERINKQITRAKQQNIDLSSVFSEVKRQNTRRGGKPKGMTTNAYKRELIYQYNRTAKQSKGGYTKSNIEKLKEEKKGYEEALAEERGVGSVTLSAEQYEQLREINEYAMSREAGFYQLLKEGVKFKALKSYKDFTRSDNTETSIEKIKAKILAMNNTKEENDYSPASLSVRAKEWKIAQLKEWGNYKL